jgi:Tol biopolymer transport system component
MGSGGGLNIWIKQLDRGPSTRLTFGNRDRRPEWSSDGQLVAFVRDSANTSAVYARPADGSGPDRPLARLDRMVQEVAWSADARWLVLRTDNALAGAGDLVGVRTDDDSTAVPLVASEFTELHPALSADGRWLAYTSNESGVNEVYVRPFPGTQAVRWQISNGGGAHPVWSPSGREPFYVGAVGRLIAAQVQPGPTFTVSGLTPLFDASGFVLDAAHQSFDVAPGGRPFVFLSPRRLAQGRAPQIVWVDNWFADLEARLRQ